jgi:pilus assembly protein Flp/PilA
MRTLISRFAKDEAGANALEYALVLILVAFAIVGGAGALGTNINTLFQNTASAVNITPPAL